MKRFNTWIWRFAISFALLLIFIRASEILSFLKPLHVVTSGFEEESLLALWKYFHHLPIYSDPHQIPFSASYFNWFFYHFYGAIVSFTMQCLHCQEAWIPTIGRMVTLGVVGLGFLLNVRLLMLRVTFLMAASLSALLWLGPLVGYWAMTVRPDLLALLFDLTAVLFLLKLIPSHQYRAVIIAAIFCYLSWACKQINITMPLAIGLFLLWEKKWRSFALFSVILVSGYSITIFLAPPMMLKMLFFMKTAIPLSLDTFKVNLINFIKKTLPIWVLGMALIAKLSFDPKMRQKLLHDSMLKLSVCGIVAWILILLPASSKIGSADNYHFIALFFVTLGVAASLHAVVNEKSRPLELSIAMSGLVFVFSLGFAFMNGSIQGLQTQQKQFAELKTCLNQLPPPIFVLNLYGALPWMNPSPVPFVLAYNYWRDRISQSFEQNGVGGLIQQGYFNTLILPNWTKESFDQASLSAYQRQEKECMGSAVFLKKERV